jgi:hypothetical protein
MHGALAQAILAHTMAQSSLELLALIGPFAVVFGAGAVLVIGPVVRSQGERYVQRPITATPTETVGIASAEGAPPAHIAQPDRPAAARPAAPPPPHPIADPIPDRRA